MIVSAEVRELIGAAVSDSMSAMSVLFSCMFHGAKDELTVYLILERGPILFGKGLSKYSRIQTIKALC